MFPRVWVCNHYFDLARVIAISIGQTHGIPPLRDKISVHDVCLSVKLSLSHGMGNMVGKSSCSLHYASLF